MTTLADIARLAGVSQATASRALRDSPLISEATRARVQAVAQAENYRPNLVARNLRLKQSQTIVLVNPVKGESGVYLSDPFLLKFVGLVGMELRKAGYDLLLTQVDKQDTGVADRYVHSGKTDGIIFMGRTTQHEHLLQIAAQSVPLVSWGAPAPDHSFCTVGIDNHGCSVEAVDYLLAQGRRRIGFIGTEDDCAEIMLRYAGYQAALRQAGLPINANLIDSAHYSGASGYAAMKRILHKTADLDAVFVASDVMAIAAMEALREAGRTVPHDVAVIGFDNIDLGAYCSPPLTTVSQNLSGAGAALLVEKLLAQVNGEKVESAVIPGKLILRQSA